MKQVSFLSGLPRSGSTVLANIIGMHPDVRATPSSPLCNIVQTMRRTWSNDQFLKAQLDNDLDLVSERLKRTTRATMSAWSDEGDENVVVNKNRGWLNCIEWLREIDPDFKMIVTIRDLRDIYASIEKRHRKTLMLDFPDNMEHNLIDVRASALFGGQGIVGSCLKSISNIGDVPDILSHLYIWRYEDFIENPQETTDSVFKFLGVDPVAIDFNNLDQTTVESDSHYNMKFPHNIQSKLVKPVGFQEAKISPRILDQITTQYKWFYDAYYNSLNIPSENIELPQMFDRETKYNQTLVKYGKENTNDDNMIEELERAIKDETS